MTRTAGLLVLSWVVACGGGDGPTAPKSVASVTLEPATATLVLGGKLQLKATPLDAGGVALAGRIVTWASSDEAVASVSVSGLVTGVAHGTATITATSEGQSKGA